MTIAKLFETGLQNRSSILFVCNILAYLIVEHFVSYKIVSALEADGRLSTEDESILISEQSSVVVIAKVGVAWSPFNRKRVFTDCVVRLIELKFLLLFLLWLGLFCGCLFCCFFVSFVSFLFFLRGGVQFIVCLR